MPSASVQSSAAPAPASPLRADWLARWQEAILEPGLPIIDPHHHLWERPGWRYLLPDLLLDTASGHNIVATVYVQARAFYRDSGPPEMRPVGEVEFANGAAAMAASGIYGGTKICAGIVGHADLTLGRGVEPVLSALLRAGGGRLRGIRHITAWDADSALCNPAYPAPPGLMADPTFREGFAALARHGLSFDAWLYHPQIDDLTGLAAAFPETRIVVDHVGGPIGIGPYRDARHDVFPRWAAAIRRLAAQPNVYVKIGGLGQNINGLALNERPEPPSSLVLAQAMRPFAEVCIEAFGAARAMFESNFPVDKASYSYAVLWNACKLLAAGASASEKADLFAGTAARFYRLDTIGAAPPG